MGGLFTFAILFIVAIIFLQLIITWPILLLPIIGVIIWIYNSSEDKK